MMNSQMPSQAQMQMGEELRRAREAQGLTLDEAASQLKMQMRVLRTLEAGDWQALGAPVFVRGQLRSYARLLGLNAENLLVEAPVAPVRPVELVPRERTPVGARLFEQLGTKLVYVVMTLGIAIPTYMVATRSPVANAPEAESTAQASNSTPLVPPVRQTVNASMAPVAPAPTQGGLVFQFNGESWVQFYGPDGSTLEKGLMKPGDRRQFTAGQLGRATVGNASEVQVSHNGQNMDMTPFLRSNVARFTVSSDGSPVVVAN